MKLIGIGGKKRSGKSTFAKYLKLEAAKKGWVSEEVSFAAPIKAMMAEVFRHELSYATFTDDSRKVDRVEIVPGVFMTVREILQRVGTDCFRNIIHQDFWVARGMALAQSSTADLVIFPDVRFGNELQAIKEKGYTIYLEKLTDDPQPMDNHPSEMELERIMDGFDHLVFAEEGENGLKMLEEVAEEVIQGLFV